MSRRQSPPWAGWIALLALGCLPVPLAHAAVPEWLGAAAQLPTPAHAQGAPAVVLLDERAVTVEANGESTMVRRLALRVLARGGETHATAAVGFLSGEDSVKTQGPWLLRAGKEVKPPRSGILWTDESLVDDASAYTEYRAKRTSFSDLAFAGDVFGFETRVHGPNLFANDAFHWRERLPSVREVVRMTLPAGWTLAAHRDGEFPLQEVRSADGLTWTWTLEAKPYQPDEPYAPEENWINARVLVALQPPAGAKGVDAVRLASWSDVAAWQRALAEGQCDRDPSLQSEVARLTAGIDDPLGRMRAIARHVQKLRYVSVNRDIGVGFGYRPRKATEVNAKGWGDCKDKANLMCAMLREAGFTAYSASAHLGLGRLITPDCPTPQQFNHAIVAILVDESVNLPAVVVTPRHGRVLFFDATDAYTALGDLNRVLQGTRAHILAEGSNELTELPSLPFQENRCLARTVRLTLASEGAVHGVGSFAASGQTGASLRARVATLSAKELQDYVGSMLGNALRGALIQSVRFNDDLQSGRCELEFVFTAPTFLQFVPGDLALAKLEMFNRVGVPNFAEKERHMPVEFGGMQLRDRVELTLSEPFAVEELPEKRAFAESFARYGSDVRLDNGVVVFERVLDLEPVRLPVDHYERVRRFMQETVKADRVSVVLRIERT